MFQVPISAPTASRMKIAPIADETPPTTASLIARTRVAEPQRQQPGRARRW